MASVDPWTVDDNVEVDYDRLVQEFGTRRIDAALLERFERVTQQPLHPWLRRGIYFSHRGLEQILDAVEAQQPIFLYTGRGPSTPSMHLGHYVPFAMTLALQKAFKCHVVIQMADDEEVYFKRMDERDVQRNCEANIQQIWAMGFERDKTHLFCNSDKRQTCQLFQDVVYQAKRCVTLNTLKKTFGFQDQSATVGMLEWPFYQAAAAFARCYSFLPDHALCLVVCAVDQDVYFRLARDLAASLKLPKPCCIHSIFLPGITGPKGKMSSSAINAAQTTLFLNEPLTKIRKKIMKHMFSGGRDTAEEHRRLGGDPDADMALQYLRYFEPDDAKLAETRERFRRGELLCGDVKQLLVDALQPLWLD